MAGFLFVGARLLTHVDTRIDRAGGVGPRAWRAAAGAFSARSAHATDHLQNPGNVRRSGGI